MSLALTPATRDALARWGNHLSALDGAAANTVKAYVADVTAWAAFLASHMGGAPAPQTLCGIGQSDMRAFMAHERARGLGARSLARRLSAVRAFVRWLTDREGGEATAILAARGPKYRRKLPRPLSPGAAQDMIAQIDLQAREDWVAARDTAVVTLLYGCGLRISEALSLTVADQPLPASCAHSWERGQGTSGSGASGRAGGGCRLCAPLPLSVGLGTQGSSFSRHARRAIEPAPYRGCHGTGAPCPWPSGKRHPPRDAPFLRHPSSFRRR